MVYDMLLISATEYLRMSRSTAMSLAFWNDEGLSPKKFDGPLKNRAPTMKSNTWQLLSLSACPGVEQLQATPAVPGRAGGGYDITHDTRHMTHDTRHMTYDGRRFSRTGGGGGTR